MAPGPLCPAAAIADPGSAAFTLDGPGGPVGIMVIHHGGAFYAYLNSCPHAGLPLDWEPGRFLDRDRRSILCSAHGASFAIADGQCLGGPCAGRALTPLPLCLRDGMIFVELV